ncbi:MAG: LysR substrate-binding domain-containing protein [Lautropia sp.]
MLTRRIPPLNSLRAFEAVARHQSLSRAAEELSVTHSSVSRQIARLEEFLNVKLFSRRNQQLVLTMRAAAYAARLQTVFDQIHEATVSHFSIEVERARLRIGVLPTFAMRFLIPRLARFRHRYPEVGLQVDSRHDPDPFNPDLDVVIWLGRGDWPGVVAVRLFSEQLVPVGSPDLLAGHRIQHADDLKPFLLLHAAKREGDWQRWLTMMGASSVDGRNGLLLEFSGLVYQGAVDGLGLAMAQTMFVQDDLRQHRLVPVMDKPLRTGRSYYLVHAKGRSSPGIERFTEWLIAESSQGGNPD